MTNHIWQKRQAEQLTCPSGQVVTVRRPGPELGLRAGRIARTFTAAFTRQQISKDAVGEMSAEELGMLAIEKLTEAEMLEILALARELLVAMLVSPKLVAKPSPGLDDIGPDDVPNSDFWFLFNHAMSGLSGIPVPIGDGQEVSVAALENFRPESSLSGNSSDGSSVLDETKSTASN